MITTNPKATLLALLALLMLSVPTRTRAQLMQASLSHYSTDDGLASNAVSKLRSDDYGYLWLATWNGISRFDGFNFYNYKTGIASGIRGLHNRIDDMIIDQAQNVWLKMYDGRMFVINRKTDRIEDPLAGISGHDELHVDYFFTPYVTSTGDVLIYYDNLGIYKIRLDKKGLKQDLIMTGKRSVSCVVEGYRTDIWAGTDEGIHRIDMANLSLERKGYLTDEHITRLASNGYNIYAGTKSGKMYQFSYGKEPTLVKNIGNEITGLYIDSHGLLWFSDLSDGAYRLNPETGDVKRFTQRVPVPEFTSRGAEFYEAMGVVWVRMNHGGYGYYNRETDEVEYFHNDPANPWNLSNSVNANLEMNEGVVWESTSRRGLDKLEILKNTISRTRLVPGAESMLANETRALYYDADRHLLLVGNKMGSLYITDQHGNRTVITHDSSGKPFSRFYGISKDSKGNYWLCDKDNGVYKMTPNGQGYHIINIRHRDGDKWSLSSNSAYQALEDHEGNIWVATYGGGVNILRKNARGEYIAINSKNELKRYPAVSYQKVRTIALDKDNNVWVGTTDGILIMSLHNNKFSIQQLLPPKQIEHSLMSNDIITLCCDRSGAMWVGTNSGGLSHTTTKDADGNWQFETYGIDRGLPSEEIRSMTFDNKGNIWFSTDHILCSFDVKKKIFSTFSNLDGVDDTMCSENAAIALPNGDILFGTYDGYYVVNRSKLITKTGSLLKLQITDFFLNEQLQSPRLTKTFNYYVPESKRVELPDHNGVFTFRFAALNYQLQHRTHYQYRLEGYDTEWHNAGKSRTATYSNVPAGTYRFQVKAFLLESPENYDMRTIEVVVPPYFLLSESAIWLYMALVAILLLTALWMYQRSLKRRHAPAASTAPKKDDEPDKIIQKTEEKTDEYEIIEN